MRTQGMYQMLDQGFVGLIFSCFSEDAAKVKTRKPSNLKTQTLKLYRIRGSAFPDPLTPQLYDQWSRIDTAVEHVPLYRDTNFCITSDP